MYKYIKLNWRIYSRYFWDPGILSAKEISERKIYNMNEWLILSKYKDMTSQEYSALQLKIFGLFLLDFFSKPDIYDNLEPNTFAKKTLMNPIYLENPSISKVYILSRSVTDAQRESKERFVKKYFGSKKIEFIHVPREFNKGSVMKSNNINFDLFVDDEIPNIRAVAETFDSLERKEFLIPRYGYNEMPIELKALIEEKGGIITYYDPFKK